MLPLISGRFIDDLILKPTFNVIVYYIVILVIANVSNIILSYFIMLTNINIQMDCSFDLNLNVIKKIQHISINYLENNDITYLNQRINNDSNVIIIFVINLKAFMKYRL